MGSEEYIPLIKQTDIDDYRKWSSTLVDQELSKFKMGMTVEQRVKYLDYVKPIIDVAERWNIRWQVVKNSIEAGDIRLSYSIRSRIDNRGESYDTIAVGLSWEEVEKIERKCPELISVAEKVNNTLQLEKESRTKSYMYDIEGLVVDVAKKISDKFREIVKNDLEYEVSGGSRYRDKKYAIIFLKEYFLTSQFFDDADKISAKASASKVHNSIDGNQQKSLRRSTFDAVLGNLKKRNSELKDGYEGAARLACEIGRRGPKNGNPWSEAEILTLANELGVSIKGDCLKAFKAGMPADLVKKDAGARPITPREESPDDVES